MSPPHPKLIIIVPAYNEEKTIGLVLNEIKYVCESLKKDFEVLIVMIDDGSTDATASVAKDAGVDEIISHKVNQGLGAAVRSGLNFARSNKADYVVKLDADLQHEPKDMLQMIQVLQSNQADLVYGNRFRDLRYKMPFLRYVGNKIFIALMQWLTKWQIEDSQPGFFALNQNYLFSFYFPGDFNYTQQILLDAYHKGMRFIQVPITFNKRSSGKSFVDYKYPFVVLTQIIRILISVNPLKVFTPISFVFILISLITVVYDLSLWLTQVYSRPIQHSNLVLGCFLFGIEVLFFGFLADLIIRTNVKR